MLWKECMPTEFERSFCQEENVFLTVKKFCIQVQLVFKKSTRIKKGGEAWERPLYFF